MEWEKVFMFLVVWMYSNTVNTTDTCTYSISFPTLNGSYTVWAQNNEDVVLQFDLGSNCIFSSKTRLRVFQNQNSNETGTGGTVCSIWPGKKHYVSQPSNCRHMGKGLYEFRRTVQLRDNGVWVWHINTEPQVEEKVLFCISEKDVKPPNIHPPTRLYPVTTAADIRRVSTVVSSMANRASDNNEFTRSSTTLAITTGDTSEAPGSKQVVSLTVVISVTIAAVAATLITFRFVSVNKRRNNNDIQPQPRVQAVRDEEGQGQDAENTPAYHYYWEIRDDALSASSGAPAFSSQAPSTPPDARECLADGYMTPVASRAVINNTDGARNVIPMYHNSRCALRKEATASDVTAPGRIVNETQCDADGYLIPVKTGNTRSKHSLNKNAYPKRDSNQ